MKKTASDAWIALSVIGCSIVLFIALSLGLSGRFLVSDPTAVKVRFPDVTGIKASSPVKFAGAKAGAVTAIRILSAKEREADPKNLVEVTMHLLSDVPPLSRNTVVTISSDTLLSDKFLLLGGEPGPPLSEGDFLQGVPPTTFDQLSRSVDETLQGLHKLMAGGAGDSAGDVLSRLHRLVDDTQGLVTGLKPVVVDAREVVGDAKLTLTDARAAAADARTLLADNKDRVGRAIIRLDSAAGSIDSLAKRGESILRDNERSLNRTIADFRITAENLKVTATFAKFLLRDLAARPSRLIWGGGRAPSLPDERQILESRQTIPLN